MDPIRALYPRLTVESETLRIEQISRISRIAGSDSIKSFRTSSGSIGLHHGGIDSVDPTDLEGV